MYNDNLLYHGCVPLNEDGSLKDVEIYGKTYRGKELYDVLDSYVRKGFFALDEKRKSRPERYYVVYLAASGFTAVRKK